MLLLTYIFSAIVHLKLSFRKHDTLIYSYGTGWLLYNNRKMNTVVTNGHNALGEGGEHLMDVEITSGYNSNNSETQKGICVVITAGWYQHLAEDCDIALIRLERPFENANELKWVPTQSVRPGSGRGCDVLGYLWEASSHGPNEERTYLTRSPGIFTLGHDDGMEIIRHYADTDKGKWASCIE